METKGKTRKKARRHEGTEPRRAEANPVNSPALQGWEERIAAVQKAVEDGDISEFRKLMASDSLSLTLGLVRADKAACEAERHEDDFWNTEAQTNDDWIGDDPETPNRYALLLRMLKVVDRVSLVDLRFATVFLEGRALLLLVRDARERQEANNISMCYADDESESE